VKIFSKGHFSANRISLRSYANLAEPKSGAGKRIVMLQGAVYSRRLSESHILVNAEFAQFQEN
jgi:hypothetical protein